MVRCGRPQIVDGGSGCCNDPGPSKPHMHFCSLLSFLVALLSFMLNFNSLYGGFVFDDHEVILSNNDVRSDSPWSQLFTHDYWGMPLSHNDSHKSYRPLTVLTFRLNHRLHGLDSFGFHLVNVVLHSVVCILLLHVLIKSGVHQHTAAITTLLFTVHPIHTEAVANIVGRAEILSAIFYLLSFLMYLNALYTLSHYQWIYLFISVCFAITSMLCKEQGVTVLGTCLLYELYVHVCVRLQVTWPFWRYKGLLMSKRLLFVSFSSVIIVFGRLLIANGSPNFTESDNPASFSKSFQTRILTYTYLTAVNVWLLLSPSLLCFDWSMGSIPLVESLTDMRNVHTIVIFTILITLGLKYVTKVKYTTTVYNKEASTEVWSEPSSTVMLGLLFLTLPFLPASNLFFPVGFVIAERVLYLPSIGFCVLVAVGLRRLSNACVHEVICLGLNKRLLACLTGLLLLLSTKTLIRNQEWHDSFMLTTSALRTNPGNAKIHFSMGNELAQKGNRSCEEFYKEALRLKPDYTLALVNLGLVYLNTGRPKEAEQSYKKALSIKPDHINANTNMGHFYRLQKRWKEALTHYKQALRRRPDSPIFHYYIAWMYGELNEVEEAERELTTCLLLQPNYGDAHLLYGKLLASNERRSALTSVKSSKAIYHYKRGILLTSSNNVNDYIGLGKLLANQDNFVEAKEYFLKALRLEPGHLEAQLELNKIIN